MPRSPSRRCSSCRSRFTPFDVVLLVDGEVDAAVGVEGDPVVRLGEVLAAQPEVDGVVGQLLERHLRATPGRPSAARWPRICSASDLPEHLDAAQGVVPVRRAEVPVVERQRLLEPGLVRLHRDGPSSPGCCAACSGGRRRRSRWPGRSGAASLADRSSRTAEFTAPQATTTMSAVNRAVVPSPSSVTTAVTVRPLGSVSSRVHVGVGHQRDVVVAQRRVDAHHLGVGLGVQQAREAVDPVAADADAVAGGAGRARPGSRSHADRQVERVQPLLLQVVAQLLDPRLVLDRRVRVLRAGRPLGRVLAVPAVHDVEVLGLGVPGLEVGVVDRPGRGDAAVVPDLAEVLGPQPEQRRAVELGVAADVVVDLRRELVAVARRTRTPVPGTCRARRPRWSPSCPAPGAGSRPARAAAPACPTGPAGGRASRRRRRCR